VVLGGGAAGFFAAIACAEAKPGRKISSFADYYVEAETADLQQFLSQQLFVALSQLWNISTIEPDFHVQTMYDSFLPMNLEVDASPSITGFEKELSPQTAVHSTLQAGDQISLTGFRIARISQQQNRLSLDAPKDQPIAYRLSYFAKSVEGYEEGQIVTLTGTVTKTRQGLLMEQAQKAMAGGVDVTAVTLRTPSGTILSNPIHQLPKLLKQTFAARVSSIHGDLNLQNILVETQSKTARLIDFAKAGRNHALRDLICLETNIVTRLLPIALTEAILTPEAILPFYHQLHCALRQPDKFTAPTGLEKPFAVLKTIRETAVRYLFDPHNWTEYYTGLLIYLLGSLKFNDLDTLPFAPMPKQLAFLGAAAIQQLLDEGDSVCAETEVTPASHRTREERVVPSTPAANPPLSRRRRSTDSFSSYENGLEQLLAQLDSNSQEYADALLFQQRLNENVSRARRFGDTATRRAERAEIIDELNALARNSVGVSFNQLCQ
jgi:hypothetical protein